MNLASTENIIEQYQKRIEVMKAHVDGADIEYRYKGGDWHPASMPQWGWEIKEYRVKPKIPDSIDWSHVDPKYSFMARDKDKKAYLYENRPKKSHICWDTAGGTYVPTVVFASYKQGDMSWGDSLVERPE